MLGLGIDEPARGGISEPVCDLREPAFKLGSGGRMFKSVRGGMSQPVCDQRTAASTLGFAGANLCRDERITASTFSLEGGARGAEPAGGPNIWDGADQRDGDGGAQRENQLDDC